MIEGCCDCKCDQPIPGDSCAHTLCKKCRGQLFRNHIDIETLSSLNDKVFTLEDIKKLCLQYDKMYGCHPSSEFEGRSIYYWILGQGEDFSYIWEKDMENV